MGSSPQQLEDVPELMQHIQSRLPVKAAACTSILSKSWLHAWSTIPTLKFHVPSDQESKQLKLDYFNRTLIRVDLNIMVENRESASLAEKWIRTVAAKTCLKELSLAISFHHGALLLLPEEILFGENLTKIRVSVSIGTIMRMSIRHNPPIVNCVSLRELHLSRVNIKQQLLDQILSSCRSLVQIELKYCSRGIETIKLKSFHCLEELKIVEDNTLWLYPIVEINNVPNLRLFSCNLHFVPCSPHSISLGSSLTQLSLGGPGLVTDDASLNMIKAGFPFLESLTLDMRCWTLGSFHFTCDSPIKRLSLMSCPKRLIDIQVNALKLLFFYLNGFIMPSLSFPISTAFEEITLQLSPGDLLHAAAFYLKMREALELSSKCNVHITTGHWSSLDNDFDLDDLKSRLKFPPAMNVETLAFETWRDKRLWENSSFFDAFFEIFHPKLVTAKRKLREVLEKKSTTTASWPHYLKHVQTLTTRHKIWETLLSSCRSNFLYGRAYADFKLEWSYS